MKATRSRICDKPELIKLYEQPRDKLILAYDTEDDSKGMTYMVNIFDGLNHYTFRHTETAVEYILALSDQYKKGIEIWSANQLYDIGNTFRVNQDTLSFVLAGSRFITGKIYKEKIKFKDILNVIPGASVKKLGKMIGFEKLETDDFNNEFYCQTDTEIVYWSLLQYKKTLLDLGVVLKNTAAGTGFSALLKEYKQLTYNSFKFEDHLFLKQGYYGGRTEIFNTAKQKGDVYCYDIVSSYPHAMTQIPICNTYTRYYTKKPDFRLEGMCECIIEAPDDITMPYLPVRIEDKLSFPIGIFHGTWTYFEIRESLKLGYKIKKVIKALEFPINYNFTLKDFVMKFFNVKSKAEAEKNMVLREAAKTILNASYGKFALSNERSDLVALNEIDNIKPPFSSIIYPNNQIMVTRSGDFAPSTNFLIASLITAYGRHALYEKLILCSSENRIPLYCDTDSVFYKGEKLAHEKSPKLGSFNLQYECIEAHFILPKTYYIKFSDNTKIYKCKGVRDKLAELFFTKGFAESMQPLKYVETCRKNYYIAERNKKKKDKKITVESLLPFNLWVNKPKKLNAKYNKRIKLKHGATKPIKLNFDLETNTYI